MLKFALLLSLLGSHVQTPPPAAKVVADAQSVARSSNRNVMVLFHASWCGWCHRMEGVMKQPAIKPIIDKYFVVTWLVTLENGDKKALENAGADALMAANGGKNMGIPFFYFTNATGKTIATSLMPPGADGKPTNTGCPYEKAEIDHFMGMLKIAAPKMTASEAQTLRTAFEALKLADGKR